METKDAFRMRFKAARKELGLSQSDLADRIGVSRTIVSDWEQGRSSPAMDKFSAISQALEKPIAYFFSTRDNPEQFGTSFEELEGSLNEIVRNFLAFKDCLVLLSTRVDYFIDAVMAAQTLLVGGDEYMEYWAKKQAAGEVIPSLEAQALATYNESDRSKSAAFLFAQRILSVAADCSDLEIEPLQNSFLSTLGYYEERFGSNK